MSTEMSSALARAAIAAGMLVTLSGCATDAFVTRAPLFPLEDGGVYVSARHGATASAVRAALAEAGLTLTDEPEQTRLVVVPRDGKAQLGFDSGSCGSLRNRHWDVYWAVPGTASRQSTALQQGAFSETEAQTIATGGRVLTIKSKTYDKPCTAHPQSAYDQMARELARFMPARRPL